VCGICGKLNLDSDAEISRSELEAMCVSLRHRGPDDYGVYQHGPVGLGATRLAIIDLAGGHQPMHNETRSIWGVLNGEIYNYQELRADLLRRGHQFSSHCDTEVVIHLYEEWGDDFVQHLQGMFAIALWDARRRRLLLARDRLGIKPLFYAQHNGSLVFGSEIKALLVTDLPRRVDPIALHDYLSFDYVPGPRTMFEGICKLQAGHLLVCEGPVTITRYWDVPPQTLSVGTSLPDMAEHLKGLLADAVRSTMVSDVPVGAFLSGGLDSSIVVALMSEFTSEPVRTFSVGFQERSYNELPYARKVAQRYGTDHHEVVVEPQINDVIHAMVDFFDEPFADSSAVAAYYVSEVAARHVKVVMSGDGGDEIFGGYTIYQADRLANLYRRLPRLLGERAIPSLVRRIPASDSKMSWDLKLRRFVEHARLDPLAAHGSWRLIFTEEMKHRLYADHAARHDSLELLRGYWQGYPQNDALNRFMYVDTKVSLVDDMLTKVDRMSMAHSLEVRVPLLDHRLVEWMSQVPSSAKVRGMNLKYLLKHVARELLPREIVDRPKAGFHVPIPAWLKGELRPLIEEQLGETTVTRQGMFDPAYVRQLLDDNQAGRHNYSRNIWGLLMFSLWYDRYIERVPVV
jgi:asparagine synthase (glutamine-hydrolysing)